jgi:hypothetical protein
MKYLLLLALVLVAGWTYRSHIPLFGGGQAGTVRGAERWLTSSGNNDFSLGPPLTFAVRDARCRRSHQPSGSVVNPSVKGQGIGLSWYQCTVTAAVGRKQRLCVGAGDLGAPVGVEYFGIPGSCDHLYSYPSVGTTTP